MQFLQERGCSQLVQLLRAAPEDSVLAQRYAECCSDLTGFPLQIEPKEKARVLWLGLSRGHALLKQAVEWDKPCIVGKEQPNHLDGVRGSLWRYVMAFSGWERSGRAVLWDGTQQRWFQQRFLARLFVAATDLTPPRSIREQVPPSLKRWLASSLNQSRPLPDFLALGDGQVDFVSWLIGEPQWLHHGQSSPASEMSWHTVRSLPPRPSSGVWHPCLMMALVYSTPFSAACLRLARALRW